MGLTFKNYRLYLNKEISDKKYFLSASEDSVRLIRRVQLFYKKSFLGTIISKYYINKLVKKYGIFIHPDCEIGIGLKLPHPNGIIIGKAVKIGNNCTIYQQVTIGSSNVGDYKLGKQPKIKDNVILFSGAKIIGDIVLDSGTVVGANSVLKTNTEFNSVYVGILARRVK